MPSGNVPLLEAVKSGNDMLKRGVVETIIQESPIVEMLPWITIQGNAYKHKVEESLPTTGFRQVNAGWTKSFGVDTEHFWGTAIMGGEVFIDNYELKVVANQENLKAKQYGKYAKSNALTFDYYFLNGTGTADDFKGVKTLIAEGHGQSLVNAVNGGTLNLDKMDEAHDLLRTGTADAVLLNRTVRRTITKKARTTVTGVSLIDVGTDAFGRQVITWNDIPLRILGDDATGTALLPYTEDPGDAVLDCTSIYFVRFGEDFVTGLLGAGGSFEVVDFGETQAAPGHLGRLEWYPGIGVFNKYAIVRLYGIDQT